jgi:iron complex outermembrane receptor protein
VAVSTINAGYIIEKASNQEFPELLKTTPGVYATRQGGGYGDSRINLRGFNSENVAVLINGVPVNDMENGRVYWSNWAGLTDVTRAMQVQRGLGASRVAVPSIGGTINIITKTTDAQKGGYIFGGIGNDNYQKTAFSFSTGLTDNDWAVSVQGARITGDGWAEGLQFEGYNYFFNVSKILNEDHTLSLTGFGAPQWHGQRQSMLPITTYLNAPQGIRYNPDWGIRNGQIINIENNFYHKPQFSLNHYWTIDETSELSTAVYVSTGTGGGGGYSNVDIDLQDFRTGDFYSPIDLDAVVDANVNSIDGHALAFLRASRNDHKWYGVLSTYKKEDIADGFDLLGGLDLRYYKGIHFTEVTDLLGAEYALDNSNVNAPVKRARVGDKISYYNDGIVLWEGAFVQGEYTSGPLSAFVSLAGSNTSYKRIDYFLYENDDPLQETDFAHFLGYQTKGGANYNLNRTNNIFANIGYFEKAPHFNAVYQNNQNVVNEDAENQKIMSFELGYGFRGENLSGNVNLYRTTWMDRTFTRAIQNRSTGEVYFANILGVDALHQGIEFDLRYEPVKGLFLSGMLSLGDWTWLNNVSGVTVFDEDQNPVQQIPTLYIEGLKVGDAAQNTAFLGMDYRAFESLKFGLTYNFYNNLYASYDPISRTGENRIGIQPWKVPDYGVLDANVVFDFTIGNLNASVYGNINNVFNEEYVSDAQDGDFDEDGIPDAAGVRVYYGIGRTWTTGLRIKF